LIDNLGNIVIQDVQKEPLLDCSFSWHFEFPALFSVSSKINVSGCCPYITLESCLIPSNLVKSKAPDVPIKDFKDLEEYLKGIIEQHVESVPPALGAREELKAEILDGMTATWHLVSCQFQHAW
jgi:hypothetical protein